MPEGYAIVGVYDEEGELISDSDCAQTFVAGQTRVVAFEVIDLESPEPTLTAQLTVGHPGGVLTIVDVEIEGFRLPSQPLDMQASSPLPWLIALAIASVAAIAVTNFRFSMARRSRS